jgi:small subunit ribosomal protein S17
MADKTEKKAAPKAAKPAASPKAGAPKAAAAPAPAARVIPPAPISVANTSEKKAHGFRRKLVGRITSDKMDKTVVVEVIRNALDPVYKKYIRERERYKAHDATNQYKIGDRVEIQEHRPISRDKRWLVTKLISRAVQE